MPGEWRFVQDHLDRAIEGWKVAHHPTPAQVDAFYNWALELAEAGPPAADVQIGDTDQATSFIPSAQVFVDYLAVLQDRMIFIRSIEPV